MDKVKVSKKVKMVSCVTKFEECFLKFSREERSNSGPYSGEENHFHFFYKT